MTVSTLKNGVIIFFLFLITALVWYCKNPKVDSDYYSPQVLATHSAGIGYTGTQSCLECHEDIVATHMETAHHHSSSKAEPGNIRGKLDAKNDLVDLIDVRLGIVADDTGVYQVTTPKSGRETARRDTLDLVIGSGVKGQSFLTWQQDRLFQLQTSYYTPSDSWINSPNFPNYKMERPVTDACLKCHVTFAQNHDSLGKSNRYMKDQLILGIECERCHGPAEQHVVYHRKNKSAASGKYLVAIDSLSRQKRLDICIQCHSGLRGRQIKGNPFSFVAGEDLSTYSRNYYSGKPQNELDVHGNQYGLLQNSKCFRESPAMDCITCHDPHNKQRGDSDHFNQKCMACHNQVATECSRDQSLHKAMGNNCVACHMPLSPSRIMQVRLPGESEVIPVPIRTHLIAIYPENAGSEKE
jgi:hypothetical protein